MDETFQDTCRLLSEAAAGVAGVDLLVLFGSRARGDATEGSDWDLGFLGAPAGGTDALYAAVAMAVPQDVDLVDLSRANGLLRFRAASDGVTLYEATPGAFDRFWWEAVHFWYDIAPIVEAEAEATLRRLG